jgi:serine/threonine protein kinase
VDTSSPGIKIEAVPGPGAWLVKLAGVIDEAFDRSALGRLVERCTDPIVFDLDGVKRITSFGVREWIEALKALPVEQYYFIRCRPALVSQFNMVANFGWCGQLVSFYCPFTCPDCEREIEVLLDLRKQHALVMSGTTPEVTCPDCRTPADFDDIPDAYYVFASSAPPPEMSPGVELCIERLLGGGAGGPRAPFKVEKEVEGRVTALWLSGTLDKQARFKRLADGLEGLVVVINQGLSSPNPDGITRFLEFCHAAAVDLYLARLPLAVAGPLSQAPTGTGRASMASVMASYHCRACEQPRSVEMNDALRAATLERGPSDRPCPYCGEAMSLAWSDAERALITRLPLVAVPREVADYLLQHRTQAGRAGGFDAPVRTSQPGRRITGPPGAPAVAAGGARIAGPAGAVGKYQLMRLLGMGGMAEVFLARNTGPEGFAKSVVVKRILQQFSRDPHFVEMFLQEAKVAARISHSNVVQIFDLGKADDDYFIVMEYVRGWNLNVILRHLAKHGPPLPLELACRILSDICAGLAAAHGAEDDFGRLQAIVHRDVSPHNVLISVDGMVKLTDFGIAKAVGGVSSTKTGRLKGKIMYMAPEMVREERVDPRADLYAAGMVLYQCLALRHPFEGKTEYQVLHAILTTPVPSVTSHRAEVPEALAKVVERALERNKTDRFDSARTMQLELERIIAEMGRPATNAHLAIWMHDVLAKAEAAGTLPSDLDVSGGGGSIPSGPGFDSSSGGGTREPHRPADADLMLTEPGGWPAGTVTRLRMGDGEDPSS